MSDLMTFSDAIEESEQFSKRHLILGNGFSIGCRADIFHYESLFGKADFSRVPNVEKVFEVLKTQDFEIAIRALGSGALLMPVYAPDKAEASEEMITHAAVLKEILVETIAGNHPGCPGEVADVKFWACRSFLGHFVGEGTKGQVYTLNYDLLLYWSLMHDDAPEGQRPIKMEKNDGFGNDEDDPDTDYVVWHGETGANQQRIHYLHGALHLFDAGVELKKYTWVRKGIPLVEQVREAISENAYPLFVSEGSSSQKKNKIRHNAYLYHSYKSMVSNAQQTKPCFFIYGHSLAENDDHILKRLGKGKFPKLYVGLYGDPSSKANRQIIRRAKDLAALRNVRSPLEVSFYDASTANVWGDN